MSLSSTTALLRYALLIFVPLAALLTTQLYLYPVFNGCGFPLSAANGQPISDESAFWETLQLHLPAPQGTSRLAPFRLLALGDPQLEGDTSIPNAHGDSFPHLAHALDHVLFRSTGIRLWERMRLTLHDLVDFWFQDLPNTAESIRKRIDHVGNDYYLAHIYRTMRWWARPTHVAVLGDLLGSQWISDAEFARRADRYWNRVVRDAERVPDDLALYPSEEYDLSGYLGQQNASNNSSSSSSSSNSTAAWTRRIINVAGNHDIGYAGDITDELLARFERLFGKANYELRFELSADELSPAAAASVFDPDTNPDSDRLVPELRIININDMNLDTPARSTAIQDQTYAFVNAVINTATAVEFQGHFTVILTHVPLYKPAGICVDAPHFDFYPSNEDGGAHGTGANGGGLREQNQLSQDASRGFLEGILGMHSDPSAPGGGRGRRGVILNGHDHEGCDIYHHLNQAAPEDERDWQTRRWSDANDVVGKPEMPGVREITVRSMMGDYGGNAGLLSAWFDETDWEWRFEYATCSLGRQYMWWVVHIMDLIVAGGAVIYGVLRAAEAIADQIVIETTKTKTEKTMTKTERMDRTESKSKAGNGNGVAVGQNGRI